MRYILSFFAIFATKLGEMSIRNVIITTLLTLGTTHSMAQESETAYNFLRLPVSAHVAALGGENITLTNDDATLIFHNPALISGVSDKTINLNYMTYMEGAKNVSASFVKLTGERASWGVSAQMMDYGKIKQTNVYNEDMGNFSARDIAIGGTLAYGKSILVPAAHCMRSPGVDGAEVAHGHAVLTAKCGVEVRRGREAGPCGDFSDRQFRAAQLPAHVFQPYAPHLVRHANAKNLSEAHFKKSAGYLQPHRHIGDADSLGRMEPDDLACGGDDASAAFYVLRRRPFDDGLCSEFQARWFRRRGFS